MENTHTAIIKFRDGDSAEVKDCAMMGVDASGNVLVMEMGTGDKLFINFDCVRYAGFEDTVGAVSVNDNEPETFRSSRSRTGRGRGAMAYDDVCGGLPYRVFYGSGTDRSCCLRYSFGRCGKEE